MEPILVYAVKVSYCYEDEDTGMREQSLDITFLAPNTAKAVESAVAWAKNRYEAIYKTMYKHCQIGCVKLYQKQIAEADSEGYIPTKTVGFGLFEWKYDQFGIRPLDWYVNQWRKAHESIQA
jgi:hypothetical protein